MRSEVTGDMVASLLCFISVVLCVSSELDGESSKISHLQAIKNTWETFIMAFESIREEDVWGNDSSVKCSNHVPLVCIVTSLQVESKYLSV